MYAHLADTIHFQPACQVQSTTVFAWLKQRLDALRRKQAAKQEIQYLHTLDHNILADMGIDISVLGNVPMTLASFNPHVIAMGLASRRDSRGSL